MTTKHMVTVIAVPARPKIENMGIVTDEMRRRTPRLSFAWRKRTGSVMFASPEKNAARVDAAAA